jgi:hypothetical protein
MQHHLIVNCLAQLGDIKEPRDTHFEILFWDGPSYFTARHRHRVVVPGFNMAEMLLGFGPDYEHCDWQVKR